MPVNRKTLAKAQFFQFKVLFAEGDLVGQADQFAGVAHCGAEQVGERLKGRLGLLRPGANQGQHGVQRIEQEMRADAGIQGRQPRFGLGRREGAGAQFEIAEQDDACRHRQQHRPQRVGAIAEAEGLPERILREGQSGNQHDHGQLPEP